MRELIPLGQISSIISKGTTPTSIGLAFTDTGIPFLRSEDVLGGEVQHRKVVQHIAAHAHSVLKRSALHSGDVLITIAGTIGRVGFVGNDVKEMNCNQAVAFVRLIEGIADPEYVCFVLQMPGIQNLFREFVAGGAIPNINLEQVRSIKIPVPSIGDQRCIAASLKAQLAAVEEARRAAEAQADELTQLANAVVRQSILHPDTESACLGDVLEEVKRGIGSEWKQYPVLGATRRGLALAKEPVGKKPERYKPVTVGTVFYNPMRIMIGSIAMVDQDDTPGITSPDYVVLKGKAGKVDSRWFYYWLRSPHGEHCIASLSRGAVRERMLFNRLSEGNIELPPYDVQLAASQALAQIRPMKAAIESQIKEIELLPSRLLAEAFGEA